MRTFGYCLLSIFLFLDASNLAAQPSNSLPPNTIDCAAFTKQPNGNWYVGAPTTFDIGSVKHMTLSQSVIDPHFMNVGGADLYDVLNRKCGGSHM